MRALALVVAITACTPRGTPRNVKAPDAGISIALYDRGTGGFSVVDDRRWVDITGRTIMLANIDPGATLASLVIDTVPAASGLRIGQCTRERLPNAPVRDPLKEFGESEQLRAQQRERHRLVPRPPPRAMPPRPVPAPEPPDERYAPVVRCAVTGAPGRYLVRVLYVSTTLRYRAQHDIEVSDATRATVTSRFAIATPPWRARADVVLYDGVPGSERTPVEVARGQITLDGATAVLVVPPQQVSAQLRRVYDGAVIRSEDTHDVMWGQDSTPAVWVWLELAKLRLAPGPVHVHLELDGEGVRDVDVVQASRKQDDAPDATLRLPLWIDDALHGTRQRIAQLNDGVTIIERIAIGVSNLGDVAREVFVEEHARTATRRRIERAWPKKPTADGDLLRNKIEVAPGHLERLGYTLTYHF